MNILLGISGGIAAYKGPDLVRRLRKRGHSVRCVLTANGAKLVAPAALAAVADEPVYHEAFPIDGQIRHIDLARWAACCLVAPASANLLARVALGLADDLLTTLILALEPEKPLWLAPAMNTVMWRKPVVQEHVAVLARRGARIIPPVDGNLACGEQGVGAMCDPERIAELVGGG